MFKQVLYTQWKWARMELLAYTLGAFLVPTAIMKIAVNGFNNSTVAGTLSLVAGAGGFFVFLAFVCAVGLAVRPYLIDQALKHVYSLSLPVPWSTFLGYRFLAGAVLLIAPAIAVLMGAALAAWTVAVPPTLHAYPVGMAVRFYFSALEIYSATFLLQYLAGKNAVRVVLVIFGALVIA
ncbi:MAG TPA: hypothetical protein VGQ30_06495, partial [Gemmatimonadaceae bacterium]|nr:hypothetical protein [Gemmatimonadaceae bacterium]